MSCLFLLKSNLFKAFIFLFKIPEKNYLTMKSSNIKVFNEYEEEAAYAKLEGLNFKAFVNKRQIYLGRTCDNIPNLNDEEQIIFVGHSKKISRKHARIEWNQNKNQWEIWSLSKNKIYVNGVNITLNKEPSPLPPCSAIKIYSQKFYFFPALD